MLFCAKMITELTGVKFHQSLLDTGAQMEEAGSGIGGGYARAES